MVDKKILEEELEGVEEPQVEPAEVNFPTAQQKQIDAIAKAVASSVTEALNGRLDSLVQSICDRLGEVIETIDGLYEPEESEEEDEIRASLSNSQQSALDWLNARLEQVDLEEVSAGIARGGGVYRPETESLTVKASKADRKYINWPSLVVDGFCPGIMVPEGVKYSELDARRMGEIVDKAFSPEGEGRRDAHLFSRDETKAWVTNIQELLGIGKHSEALPLFWRMFSEELSPEQLLAVYQEETVERETRQREREAEALKAEMMPVEDGGRLADWTIYHFCEELGIDFPDEGTRRRAVAKAEQSICPAQTS